MDEFSLILAVLGGLILGLGLWSRWLQEHPVPATLLALWAGMVIGPRALGLLDPAALIGAIITATDPIAASPIVTGPVAEKNLPERLRHAISFESGANDGLSYLFVFLPFLLLTRPPHEAFSHWLLETLLWEVGVATLFGVGLGVAAGKLLQVSERREWISPHWRLVYTVALSLLGRGWGETAPER